MDLYGDLPPAAGGEAKPMVADSWSKPASTSTVAPAAATQSVPMKPRTLQSASRAQEAAAAKKADPTVAEMTTAAPKMSFSMVFKPRQTISAAVKANNENQNAAAKQNTVALPTADVARSNSLASQQTYSFEVHDPYDPAKPNDYLALCQERLDEKKRAQLEEDNARELETRREEQQRVEKERAEALAAGDMSRVQASMGRGRGRGSLSNLPAWMTGESKLGEGHGRSEQGISQPVSVTSSAGGHSVMSMCSEDVDLVGRESAPNNGEKNTAGVKRKFGFMNPSCVVLLKNMVGPGEAGSTAARESLEVEIRDECSSKYGPVSSCLVKDISQSHRDLNPPEEECVRCFVCFERQESAVTAYKDLNNRFFGGRRISASFFSEDRFRSSDVAPTRGEW